ncbi:hypothetical protein BDV93DRAFT_506417 [Ceratobasidium sp. AG-I]|nr:hypothetical protein BDV93DRAFT_506417 [Ceratobasidium sp. AG-I]
MACSFLAGGLHILGKLRSAVLTTLGTHPKASGLAGLLMRSSMSDADKDRHLKSEMFMVSHDLVSVLQDMLANSDFKDNMVYTPLCLWTTKEKKEQAHYNMCSSLWWCNEQKAYLVYVTIGNLNKRMRRKPSKQAMVLLGYLPIDAFEDIKNDDERRHLKAELVHRALQRILTPLKKASEEGVEMWCPDGCLHRVFPRVAAYLADWPEQNLQCCMSEASCPVCKLEYKGRGDLEVDAKLRTRKEMLDVIVTYFAEGNTAELKAHRLKSVWPWWGDVPHVNLATCFAPDLLHQVYQGLFETHLLRWLRHLVVDKKLDKRFRLMPQAAWMRHFSNRITAVGQRTGRKSGKDGLGTRPLHVPSACVQYDQL